MLHVARTGGLMLVRERADIRLRDRQAWSMKAFEGIFQDGLLKGYALRTVAETRR